ncbi:hypothetical protein M0R45_037867 [Rubus argutus]|uniref:Uncharacterized protein n=1 Tax=Rubus argutus TaxID=59490 RepID=A0AAW1W3B2_RUBAR
MLTLGFRDVLIEDERIEYGRGDVVGQWWSGRKSVVVGGNRMVVGSNQWWSATIGDGETQETKKQENCTSS